MDKLTACNKDFHKGCFRCEECQTSLTLGSFASLEGVIYCKVFSLPLPSLPPWNLSDHLSLELLASLSPGLEEEFSIEKRGKIDPSCVILKLVSTFHFITPFPLKGSKIKPQPKHHPHFDGSVYWSSFFLFYFYFVISSSDLFILWFLLAVWCILCWATIKTQKRFFFFFFFFFKFGQFWFGGGSLGLRLALLFFFLLLPLGKRPKFPGPDKGGEDKIRLLLGELSLGLCFL